MRPLTSHSPVIAPMNKLPKVARKRLERFVTYFAKALVSDAPDTIHDLRVASRRLQQSLRLLLPRTKPSGTRKVLRFLRKVRRAFGSCRNLDVVIALIEKRRPAIPVASLRQSWDAVKKWLADQRTAALADARAKLKRYDLIDFIGRVQTRIDTVAQQPRDTAQRWERASKALAAWKEALVAAKTEPQVVRIHAFRIAGKRLRYRVESLVEVGDPSIKPLAQGLKKLQDDLGDWHDRRVLQQFVADFIARPGFLAEEPGMCRALLLEMERDRRRDHVLIDEAIARAGTLAAEWSNITPPKVSEAEATTDQ